MTRQQRRHEERQALKVAPKPPKRLGKYARWIIRNKITGTEIADAQELLMTGPRAQAPRFRAVRKMVGRLRRGDAVGNIGWSPWRSAPRLRGVLQ